MTPDPMNEPHVAAFPAGKLAPLLRAMADPDGHGQIPEDHEEAIRLIEANVAHHRERG